MATRNHSYASFPHTPWSLVARAGSADMQIRRAALADLLNRYAPAIRSYLRFVRKISPHDADDLVQEFLTSKILEQGIIAHASENQGKFRAFLLASLNNFIVSEWRENQSHKRGGNHRHESEEVTENMADPRQYASDYFDIAWARELLAETTRRMKNECRQKKRPELWGLFQHRILAQVHDDPHCLSYDALVSRYKLTSPAQFNNLLVTARRMFARTLTVVISEYESEDAVPGEIRDLTAILARH